MLVCGIDPGANPGYCWRASNGWMLDVKPCDGFFDIAACEGQFVAPKGKASRDGKALKVHHRTPLTLSFTAGMQLAEVRAELKLVMTPPVWRGLLWSDGYAGGYGLSQEATLNRLRELLPPELAASASDDEVMAFGICLAGERVGTATKGELRCGRPWKRVKQPGRYEIQVEKTHKRSAKAFVNALKKEGFK
jgi:hypothetical protein